MESSDFPATFRPITVAWFRRRFGEPSPPQRLGWPLIADWKHTLILTPRGVICSGSDGRAIMGTSPQPDPGSGGQG